MPEPSADPVTAPDRARRSVAAGVQTLVLDPAAAAAIAVERSATKKLGVAGWLAIIWLVAVIGSALLAPWLPIPEPDKKFAP